MIRDRQQLGELEPLAPCAVRSELSRGRRHEEPRDAFRLCFQKDRDRILHSRAWRRMSGKTQVFVAHHGDHYRNRLTHTLEVAQISRDVARNFGLNEDLAESIALAHDLGHTPFGHAGEAALDECLREYGLRFEHNEQSRRVVEELEQVYPGFRGLNLSVEVLEGLMKHQTPWDKPAGAEAVRPSLEAQVVNFADEIAYQNHDVDDGLRSGLFGESDLAKVRLWQWAGEEVERAYGVIGDAHVRLARKVSKMIGLMVADLLASELPADLEAVYASGDRLVRFSDEMQGMTKELREFLMTRLYFHPEVAGRMERGQAMLKAVFEAEVALGRSAEEARDFVAGMTDSFAEARFASL